MGWTREAIDPNPGGVVVGIIANGIHVPAATVSAAVFMFQHPTGNNPFIWVFRAKGLPSQTAIERWAGGENTCGPDAAWGRLAESPTLLIHRAFIDQCQPEYLVKLDNDTVALILDDGGYQGNASGVSPVPFRPAIEIAQLVVWLEQNLPNQPLMTGGPIPENG